MIARLTGTPSIASTTVIVDVQGVGYQVFTTQETQTWALDKSSITLSIYTHVTENSLELFGFKDEAEKQLFLLLLTVSGVGPKTALGVINLGYRETLSALQQANLAFFAKVPRVGKKLAQKIIIELGSKVGSTTELDLKPLDTKQQDIVAALTSLGYDELSAQQAIKQINLENLTVQEAIKQVMKQL